MDAYYPFTAVTAQKQLKLALLLSAINPTIGGVLISGPRGSAKTTLARGLADLMPEDNQNFVTLPLGASEEMLTGTLDLQQVLRRQKVLFQPGLLAKAHDGILYVDEVNLLPDAMVDLLLDVSASGINIIERDGISHQHEARFVLIGTMNPDEGELRPQLQDRFGLAVALTNQYTIEERIEIVQLREAFDKDSTAFNGLYKTQQSSLRERIIHARTAVQDIECSQALRVEIAKRCHNANVDGMRADLVWYRAALAHAAWSQRDTVTLVDIDTVEPLVLLHRRQAPSQQQPPASPPPFSRPPEKPPTSHSQKSQSEMSPNNDSSQPEGDWGSMSPQQQQTAEASLLALPEQTKSPIKPVTKSSMNIASGKQKGANQGGYYRGRHHAQKPHWFATLLHNKGQWPPKQLRYYKAREGKAVLHLILLDTSASVLNHQVFAQAKAVILNIADKAYLNREQLAILGFGNGQVENLLPRKRAPKALRVWLDGLVAGGGTPLREALLEAQGYLQQLARGMPNLAMHTYLITDGRTSQSVDDIRLLGECTLVDVEQSAVKRGKGRVLADALGAGYVSLA